MDDIASALIDLTGCLNSPRQDEVLLGEAGVALDRALFPLLVRLNAMGTTSVTELAGQVGRDPSTVSRQLARLESLGLVKRPTAKDDMRVREAAITKAGLAAVNAIARARRKLLGQLLQDWTESELRLFPELLQRLADAMKEKQRTGNSDA
ncbi:MarR family transcriptional regulator [Dyella sp. RRB7]|uniref:MarR family winged helix-turn-helix transcriptional regulator n=1 Tax=Dyella sp. RRB7 TaxID=2919502 RepID=UPI001FAA5597|nr:MarR family transcriptional regulator [Dyella sp. RRB7]